MEMRPKSRYALKKVVSKFAVCVKASFYLLFIPFRYYVRK